MMPPLSRVLKMARAGVGAFLLVILTSSGVSAEDGAVRPPEPEKGAPDAAAKEVSPPPPEAPEPSGTAVARTKQPETLLEFAVAGGFLMVPIGLSSIVWLAFVIERLVALRTKRVLPQEVAVAVGTIGRARPFDRNAFTTVLKAHPSPLSNLLRTAMEKLGGERAEIEGAVNNIAQQEVFLLRRYLRVFAIVASVAPLLGLLGTVTGLIQAFREVAMSGLGSGAALAPGIYEALITTAGGLMVAIPALLTYYGFMARVDHFVHEMDKLVVDFVESHRGPAAARG
jgi:biopolymer transport protein ExbB